MTSPLIFFVGWNSVTQPEAFDLWRPTAPKSYTKEESKLAWVQDYMSDAALLPYVGSVSEWHALDTAGVAVSYGTDPGRFLHFAQGAGRFAEYGRWEDVSQPHAIFIGFNIKQLFVSVAMEMLREQTRVPLRFWYNPPGLVDVHDLLIPGALRNGFDIGSLLQYIGPNFVPPEYQHLMGPGAAAMPSAEIRAHVTMALSRYAQLA